MILEAADFPSILNKCSFKRRNADVRDIVVISGDLRKVKGCRDDAKRRTVGERDGSTITFIDGKVSELSF